MTDRAQLLEEVVGLARSLGAEVRRPIVLAEAYSLRVHLEPSPIVARVPTLTAQLRDPMAPWLAREIEVTRFLHRAGAPVVAPCDELGAGPHLLEHSTVSFWKYVPTLPGVEPSPAQFGRMLGELHAVLRSYRGELPLLSGARNDIPAALRCIEEERLLPQGDVQLLHRELDRLQPALSQPEGPLQPLHGDAHPGNLIATEDGLLWNDFEDVCVGPVAWDLASLLVDERALAAYPAAPPEPLRALYRAVRRLHVVTWLVALPFEFDARDEITGQLLTQLRSGS